MGVSFGCSETLELELEWGAWGRDVADLADFFSKTSFLTEPINREASVTEDLFFSEDLKY